MGEEAGNYHFLYKPPVWVQSRIQAVLQHSVPHCGVVPLLLPSSNPHYLFLPLVSFPCSFSPYVRSFFLLFTVAPARASRVLKQNETLHGPLKDNDYEAQLRRQPYCRQLKPLHWLSFRYTCSCTKLVRACITHAITRRCSSPGPINANSRTLSTRKKGITSNQINTEKQTVSPSQYFFIRTNLDWRIDSFIAKEFRISCSCALCLLLGFLICKYF